MGRRQGQKKKANSRRDVVGAKNGVRQHSLYTACRRTLSDPSCRRVQSHLAPNPNCIIRIDNRRSLRVRCATDAAKDRTPTQCRTAKIVLLDGCGSANSFGSQVTTAMLRAIVQNNHSSTLRKALMLVSKWTVNESYSRALCRPLYVQWNGRVTTGRCLSSSSSSSSSPTPPSTPWQRTAVSVKNTDVTNPYLEQIRETHDPSLHLKTLEDEVRGTMGKALGKQGAKIHRALTKMHAERQEYDALMLQQQQQHQNQPPNNTQSNVAVQECIKRHNQYRQEAITARWELMVHRQAVGFIVNNHTVVTETFPIGEALPPRQVSTPGTEDGDCSTATSSQNSSPNKKFGDQLDWWQRVGRWR